MKNPPAFPRSAFAPEGVRSVDCEGNDSQEGMTLRDYFAGRALTAVASIGNPEDPDFAANVAKAAYAVADAMLLRRQI